MAGVTAFGTTLKIGGTAGTAVVNVTSIEGPGLSAEYIDTTAHDSSGSYRQFVPSFKDAGEVTLRINYDPTAATHKNAAGGLLKHYVDQTTSAYAIGFPTTPTSYILIESAYVSGFSVSAPYDGKLEADVTLRINGSVTLP